MRKTVKKSPSFSAVRVSLLLTGSLLTVLPAAHAADDDNTILGLCLLIHKVLCYNLVW